MGGSEYTGLSAVAAALVRSPLGVIGLFVLLVEAIAGGALTLIATRGIREIAIPLVCFVVLFPSVIACLFFYTLLYHHEMLYSPMEYRSDESFLIALSSRVERVEIRQDEAESIRLKIKKKIDDKIKSGVPAGSITPEIMNEILTDILNLTYPGH